MEQRGSSLEVRARGRRLEGHAALFNVEVQIVDPKRGAFRETIRAGAFSASLNHDVLALRDHDAGRVLGRTKSKTLRLSEDSRGLAFDLDVPDTTEGRDVCGSELADDLQLYAVLQDQASPRHTAFEAREILIRSALETGNGYARIERDGRGAVRAIYPLMPFMVGVERLTGGRLRYRVTDPHDGSMILLEHEVLHIRYHSRDGILGLSPLTWAGGAIGLAVEGASLAAQQAKQGLVPPGVFEMPQGAELSQPQYDRLVDSLGQALSIWRGGTFPLVLEGGTKFSGISHSAQQAELTAARKLSLQDVARVFGVPASVLGLNDHPTYGSVEEEAKALIRTCLAPWCRRIENAMERTLLTENGRKTLWIEHDLNGLLRGDQAARYSAYAVGINNGFLSANEARRAENLRARADGDRFPEPMNMRPQGAGVPQESGGGDA